MKISKAKHIALSSYMILGVLLWFIIYWVTPAKPVEVLSKYTLSYIILSLACYFAGYYKGFIPLFKRKKRSHESKTHIAEKFIWLLIILISICWLIRYFDVFFNRGLSFNNANKANRELLAIAYINPIFILGSIFKELYFLPLLLVFLEYKKNIKLLISSSVLYLYPLLMPFLCGTRKDIFMVFFFLLIVLLIGKVINVSAKTILLLGTSIVLLNVLFYFVLIGREVPTFDKSEDPIEKILNEAVYNDLLQPTKAIKAKIKSSQGIKKAVLFNYLHTTQYYTHGIFELDYLIKHKRENKEYLYGLFNFQLFPKFFEKLGIIELDLNKVNETLPRKNTYITFLGGLFVDFGWFALGFMYLIGSFQFYIDKKIRHNKLLFYGVYIFFIMFNLLFLVINILKGTGVYLVFSSIALIIGYTILNKSKFRKYLFV